MIKEKFNEFEVNGIKFRYNGEYFVGIKKGFLLINPFEIPYTEREEGNMVILAEDDKDMAENKYLAFEWLKKKVKEKINENEQQYRKHQ